MRKVTIAKTPAQCRTTQNHDAHEWYGNVTAGDAPAYHTCNGVRFDLAAWFLLRGVDEGPELDGLVQEYAGHTEDQMDRMYSALHGFMA